MTGKFLVCEIGSFDRDLVDILFQTGGERWAAWMVILQNGFDHGINAFVAVWIYVSVQEMVDVFLRVLCTGDNHGDNNVQREVFCLASQHL